MSSFTREECEIFVSYIARNDLMKRSRLEDTFYKKLVAEEWAKNHSWSAWRDHYKNSQGHYDRIIADYQRTHHIRSLTSSRRFDPEEDKKLVAFLAQTAPLKVHGCSLTKFGRGGTYVYRVILSDFSKFPWASDRSWHSWRSRYTENMAHFDDQITRWQEQNGIDPIVQLKAIGVYAKRFEREVFTRNGEIGKEKQFDHAGVKRLQSTDGNEVESEATNIITPQLKSRKLTYTQSPHVASNDAGSDIKSPSTTNLPHSVLDSLTRVEGTNGVRGVEQRSVLNDVELMGVQGQHHVDHSRNSVDITRRENTVISSRAPEIHVPLRPPIGLPAAEVCSLDHIFPAPPSNTSCYAPEASRLPHDTKTARTSQNFLAFTASPHPPTPSVSSIQSEGADVDTTMLLATARDRRDSEHSTPAKMSLPSDASDRCESSDAPGLSGATSSHTASKSLVQSPTTPYGSHSPSPSELVLTDDPFASCTPSGGETQVIHWLPKQRERSFRSTDRFRPRKFVVGPHNSSRKVARRGMIPSNLETSESTSAAEPMTSDNPPICDVHRNVAPNSALSLLMSPVTKFKQSDRRDVAKPMHGQNIPDVFASKTPLQTHGKRDSYILGYHSPPEPSSWSLSFQQSSPTVFDRSHDRRRTFAGCDLPQRLPDINLLAELKAKRRNSHSSAIWSRSSPDITLFRDAGRHTLTTLLDDSKLVLARRSPSLESVIPIITDSKTESRMSFSLEQLSSATSEIIIREGLASVFKQMEENHGFSSSVVRRTWLQQNMDLQATDKKLLKMRLAAEDAANSDEDQPDVQQLSYIRINGSSRRNEVYSRIYQIAGTEDSISTDYTPPVRSRAGHYRRFLEQGRFWNARQREIELTSRISVKNAHSTVTMPHSVDIPGWGEKEEAALQIFSEEALLELAKRFGEKALRKKILSSYN